MCKIIQIFIYFAIIQTVFCEIANFYDLPSGDNDLYHHIVNLGNKNGSYILQWRIDWPSKQILFNVTASTTGYLGFGITSTGKMSGADIVIGGVNNFTGEPYLIDMHVPLESRQPVPDNSQDYQLLSAWENGTYTSLSFSRKLETCDDHDHKINDDTIKLIWAFGEQDWNGYPLYHYGNRGEYSAYLLSPDYTPRELQNKKVPPIHLGENLHLWTVTRRQLLPRRETTYWCSFHKGPRLFAKHHLIGFNFRIDNELSHKYTHHLVFNRCRAPNGIDPNVFFQPYIQNNTGESCLFLTSGQPGGIPLQYCRETVYSYLIGMEMYFLPEHVGVPIGNNPDEYYLLQVHYDNPNGLSNVIYDINIDFFYTPTLRKNDGGILSIGHQTPGSPSLIVPPMSIDHKIWGHCGIGCTTEMIPAQGINVFATAQHTHFSGVKHRVRQFRGRRELPWIADDNNYSNLHQFYRNLRSEVKILPGDHLTTRCIYDITWNGGKAVVGGYSTRQEMCIAYLYYYNKIPGHTLCWSAITDPEYVWKHLGIRGNLTWSDSDLEYVASQPESRRGLTVGEIATNLVEWTEDKREELRMDQKNEVYMNFCARDDLTPEEGGGEEEPKATGFPRGVVREYRGDDENNEKWRKCPT